MGAPTEPVLDIMRRSMANLEIVEAHAGPSGPYEITQLVNTFLGALAHPFEAMRDDLLNLGVADAVSPGWPSIARERPTDREPSSVSDLIRLMRNGVAHGNIEFLSDGKGQILAIRLWNTDPPDKGADLGCRRDHQGHAALARVLCRIDRTAASGFRLVCA